jgi:hypothetical protein
MPAELMELGRHGPLSARAWNVMNGGSERPLTSSVLGRWSLFWLDRSAPTTSLSFLGIDSRRLYCFQKEF